MVALLKPVLGGRGRALRLLHEQQGVGLVPPAALTEANEKGVPKGFCSSLLVPSNEIPQCMFMSYER